MAERNLISVIIPVYKVSYDLLIRCIESILFQTYPYFELILVDDGSPDKCGLILDQYEEKDRRIRVIHKKNGGVGSARNTGIEEANGKFITFVDADDYVTQDYLSDLYNGICDNSADLVKCSCVHDKNGKSNNISYIDCAQKQSRVVSQNEALDNLYYSRVPFDEMEVTAVWGAIYKASIVKKIKFKPYIIGEDLVFMHDYLQKISIVTYIYSKDYIYCATDGSAMHKQYSDDQMLSTVQGLKRLIREENCRNITGFRARILNVLLTIYMHLGKQAYQSKTIIVKTIKTYRCEVLKDKKIKRKLRLALLTSYCGLPFTKYINLVFKND